MQLFFWSFFLLFHIIFSSSLQFSQKYTNQVDCSTFSSNCQECTASKDCGWCEAAGKCMNSTNGIPDGNCNIWWLTCSDEDICLDNQDCSSCTENGCGWCDDYQCLKGTSQGAEKATCQQWVFGQNQNCTKKCNDYTNCFSCTSGNSELLGSCGWCNSSSTCLPGSNGTVTGVCDHLLWNSCTTSGEKIECTKHENCSSCMGDMSDKCGWCESTNACLQKDQECSDFKKDKTCEDSCLDFSHDCTTCSTNKNCGWCNTTLCVEGSLKGPSFTNCSNWSFHQCGQNDTCLLYDDCLSCINSKEGQCGWCENGASSDCMNKKNHTQCQGQWKTTQCTAYVFTCSSLTTCEDCVNYPPGECVWCGQEGACRLAIDVGTSCQYSCGGQSTMLGPGVIAALVIVGVSIIGLALGMWYRFYWVKRHYYERLR